MIEGVIERDTWARIHMNLAKWNATKRRPASLAVRQNRIHVLNVTIAVLSECHRNPNLIREVEEIRDYQKGTERRARTCDGSMRTWEVGCER